MGFSLNHPAFLGYPHGNPMSKDVNIPAVNINLSEISNKYSKNQKMNTSNRIQSVSGHPQLEQPEPPAEQVEISPRSSPAPGRSSTSRLRKSAAHVNSSQVKIWCGMMWHDVDDMDDVMWEATSIIVYRVCINMYKLSEWMNWKNL